MVPHPQFNRVISKFRSLRVITVLDLGCGSGRHSVQLAREGFVVTGMDISEESLRLAKQWAANEEVKIEFIQGNFHKKLPFDENSFDAVLAIDTIHYDTRKSMLFTLSEIKRVLKQRGILFVTLPTRIGDVVVTHLIFSKEEIEELIGQEFQIIDSFLDEKKFLCVFATCA